MAGIYVNQGKGNPRGREGLLGQMAYHDGVLAATEQDGGALKLCVGLANYKDCLGFEFVEKAGLLLHCLAGFLNDSNHVTKLAVLVSKGSRPLNTVQSGFNGAS